MADTTKGMFFNEVLGFIDDKGKPGLKDEIAGKLNKPLKYVAFSDYPIEEYTFILEEAVRAIYPARSVEEGMFELGRLSFKTFAESMLGKVCIPRLKHNLKAVYDRIPAWYMLINKFGDVTAVDLGEKSFKVVFKGYRTYPQFQQGLLQQGMDTLGYKGTVKLKITRMVNKGKGDVRSEFECTLEWE